MALEVDQEILEDFLIEAGEILEQLSEQLVDLEQHPGDRELLNAIFRGFHTVKGGAGFLQLDPMVECCHSAENLFDQLRNDALQVTSGLMDVVLQALDSINGMFDSVRAGGYPEAVSPQLIAHLDALASGEPSGSVQEASLTVAAEVIAEQTMQPDLNAEFAMMVADLDVAEGNSTNAIVQAISTSGGDLITEDEFETLLDNLHGGGAPGVPVVKAKLPEATQESDLITEDEFDLLLNELHGASGAPGISAPVPGVARDTSSQANVEFEALLGQLDTQPPVKGNSKSVSSAADSKKNTSSELISENEFEDLLDELQQKGEGAFAVNQQSVTSVASPEASQIMASSTPNNVSNDVSKSAREAKKASADSNVRVDTRLLDQMMNMVGELVLVRNRLVRLGADKEEGELSKALGSLDMVTADLQMSVMKTRMQPVKKVFGRFPRLVRDLSRQLNKEVRLELRGEDTDLDKNLVEALADPLIHLVRNAIDHGIEVPEVRKQNGKSSEGHVLLSAEQEGDHILLIIEDDGAGMDPEKLRRLAVERGMLDYEASQRLSEHECYNLIFAAGFSTKTEVSDVSGRGVGMDVVKTKISQLNGKLEISSTLGAGSRIAIQVPLTLAIMPTLMVLLEEQAFALPLVNVNEIFSLDLTQINVVDGQKVIIVRDQALPLFHLKRWLIGGHQDDSLPDKGHVVIANVGTVQVAFVVDQLVGQEEVVIKPLGTVLQGTPGLSGATITGDGRIALILDIPNLLKFYAS